MTINEVPNIEHCTVTTIGNAVRIVANSGWYIHFDDGSEENANVWKGAVILLASDDFSKLQIVAEADLPEGADICGDTNPPEIA